nr:unnamed protein product [Spirometra erinaceieuropaei]
MPAWLDRGIPESMTKKHFQLSAGHQQDSLKAYANEYLENRGSGNTASESGVKLSENPDTSAFSAMANANPK